VCVLVADNLHETLEIVVGETLPAVVIWWVDPVCGVPLLVFHYCYEILATDALLEHNPNIRTCEATPRFCMFIMVFFLGKASTLRVSECATFIYLFFFSSSLKLCGIAPSCLSYDPFVYSTTPQERLPSCQRSRSVSFI
jgi:hypothetical protein